MQNLQNARLNYKCLAQTVKTRIGLQNSLNEIHLRVGCSVRHISTNLMFCRFCYASTNLNLNENFNETANIGIIFIIDQKMYVWSKNTCYIVLKEVKTIDLLLNL